MPHHTAPGNPLPRQLRLRHVPAVVPVLKARACAREALLDYAQALASYLPVAEGAPYDPPRGTRAKREAMLDEVYLPQALFDLLGMFPGAGPLAARSRVDTPDTMG